MRLASILCRLGFAVIGLGSLIFSRTVALKTASREQTSERKLDRIQGYINWDKRVLSHSIDDVLRDMLLKDLKHLEMEKRWLITKMRDV
jgi:hypothetical protein